MPPGNHRTKEKAKGISATSLLDLKAYTAERVDNLNKQKAAGISTLIHGGVERPDKKPSKWQSRNKGVEARNARDIEQDIRDRKKAEDAKVILQRKAKAYDALKRGKSGGLTEAQINATLVDFDAEPLHHYASDSDDVDESLTVPQALKDEGEPDDPMVDWVDDFGRDRRSRRSEVPREHLPHEKAAVDVNEDETIYNPQGYFPTYVHSDEKRTQIEERFAEDANPLNIHYDASRENRAKAAGFYQFSGNEEERERQRKELDELRKTTNKERQKTGADDIHVDGMRSDEAIAASGTATGKAAEKRKREIEERRKQLEASKRQRLEKKSGNSEVSQTRPPPGIQALDPFAALEAQAAPTQPHAATAADDFLAQIEAEMRKPVS